MKNYLKVGLLVLLPSFLFAQGGLINQGAKIKISKAVQLKILNGGISNQTTGEIFNEGQIHLEKDWTQKGNHSNYLGNGWIVFAGNQHQAIISNQPMQISNIRIDNGHHLILNNDLRIYQQLDLTNNGLIELGTNNLLMTSKATIINYDEDHYILTNNTGFLQQEVAASSVLFPIGNKTYNPATINNRGGTDDFRVKVVDKTIQSEGAVNRIWWVEEAVQGGSLATLSLQWDETQELANFDRSQSAITPITDLPSTNYSAAIEKDSYWSQTCPNLTKLTAFTVTSQTTTTLPYARLDDGQPLVETVQIFPNPAIDYINIKLREKTGKALIQIFDAKGSLILQANKAIGTQQIIRLNNIQHLVDGIYSIQITAEGQTTTHKFVKGQL